MSESSSADHVMAHFWAANLGTVEIAHDRHQGKSHFVFADGHVEALPLTEDINASIGLDLWNPGNP